MEQRYEEDTKGIEEEWVDLCCLGYDTYTVYVNGEYVINAEIYSSEDLFGISETPSDAGKGAPTAADTQAPSAIARYYLKGRLIKETPLTFIPRRGEVVMVDSGVYEVHHVSYYTGNPHVVDIFLK